MHILFLDLMMGPEYDADTPYTRGLGGTQSALCYYAEALAATEHTVTVVNSRLEPAKVRGVNYQPKAWLSSGVQFEVVVLCSGLSTATRTLLQETLSAALVVAWIPHDVDQVAVGHTKDLLYDVDLFAFVSDWQRNRYIEFFGIDPAKTMLMLNGIAPGFLGPVDLVAKKPHFLYLSQPDRGLSVVAEAWPAIVARDPDAELHTYSSRKLYGGEDNAQTLALFDKLKAQPNVFLHEPVGQSELVAKCREAAFLLYPTTFFETGCIVVTEACAAGCLPVVTELGALGTYFNNCLPYDDSLVENCVKRAGEFMDLFGKPKEFAVRSQFLVDHFQQTRDYKTLAAALQEKLDAHLADKQRSLRTHKRALEAFHAKDFFAARLHLDNMTPFFLKRDAAFQYFLSLGVCRFYSGAYHAAAVLFDKAAALDSSLQLCVNQILTHEKLENDDKLVEWCEKALTYKFDMKIVTKVLTRVQKKSYFERCKWNRYLLSLWNDDIQDSEWMTLFLSHGNMTVADYMLVGKHEEGISMLLNILQKGFAYAELHKIDLKKPSLIRGNIEKLFCNLFLNLNYCETRNPEFLKSVNYYKTSLPPLLDIVKPVFAKKDPAAKRRIGFLSGDFIYHPVSYILSGIVANFDKTRYEPVVFSTTPKSPANRMQQSLRDNAFAFHDLENKSTEEIAKIITEADVDLLIEMSGHTSNGPTLLGVLRHKPARVVAQYFAYPNTYGIPEVDYKIGDKHVFPPGLEAYYTEGFCKIEGGLHTYRPIVELSVNRKAHGGIVFGCTNNPKKYRPAWIHSVAAILKRVPGSKFKCRYFNLDDASIQEYYFKEFDKHGVSRDRVDLQHGLGLEQYFQSYADMDICLDPFPYNGGTINIETLYAGLPYITLLGTSYVSRVGASILHQVGHPELIAKTPEAYVEYAVALATDKDRLDAYKATIREDMMKSTLGDNAAFTRAFEAGCEWMLKEKGWAAAGEGGPTLRVSGLTHA